MAKLGEFNSINMTKGNPPRLPFKSTKEFVLGKNYCLNLVFVSDKLSQKLNLKYRNKNNPANVLAFSYDKNEGEIFINLRKAKKEMPEFNLSFRKLVGLLFIHALFHLKGYSHGSRMESKERETLKRFGL